MNDDTVTEQIQERVFLTLDEAVALLPDSEMIHTFRTPAMNVMLGCDWCRDDILALLESGTPELAGEIATSMNHGIVIWSNGWLFIETRNEA